MIHVEEGSEGHVGELAVIAPWTAEELLQALTLRAERPLQAAVQYCREIFFSRFCRKIVRTTEFWLTFYFWIHDAEALSILKFEKPSSVLPKKKRFFDSA